MIMSVCVCVYAFFFFPHAEAMCCWTETDGSWAKCVDI